MNCRDLRIGNLVKDKNGKIIKVAQVTKKKIGYHTDNYRNLHYLKYNEIEGIRLGDDSFKAARTFADMLKARYNLTREIGCLHELQNLNYAIFGCEYADFYTGN